MKNIASACIKIEIISIIGEGVNEFAALPTKLHVLKYACPLLFEQRLNKKKASLKTAHAVQKVWNDNGLDSQYVIRIAQKITRLIDTYNSHRYNVNSDSVRVVQHRTDFLASLDSVFDVRKDAAKSNKRAVNIPAVEAVPIADVGNVNENGYHHQRKRNAINNMDQLLIDVDEREYEDANDRHSEHECGNEEFHNFGKIYPSDKVCAMLDRAGISNKLASYAFLTILMEAGMDEKQIVCSETTMFRRRAEMRLKEATRIRQDFRSKDFKTVHFDGKTYFGRGNVLDKRLAIVLSKPNESKVLAVQNVKNGKADTLAAEIHAALLKWNAEDVDVVCFDTEAVNSGRLNGVSLRLERLCQRELLKFACRRHVYEVFLGAAFNVSVERGLKTEGPTIPIFERFATEYFRSDFDTENYTTIYTDPYFVSLFGNEEIQEIIALCRRVLPTFKNSRNEYTELARLVVILLSPNGQCEFKINKPGAYTRGRFMNRIIYCIRIYMYRNEATVDVDDLDNIRQFLFFSVKIYLKYWFETSFICKAPNNDILFIKKTLAAKNKIPIIVDAVSQKMENHLWYLKDVNVALALFDDNVSTNTKQAMVRNLNRPVLSNPENNPLRLTIDPGTIEKLKNITLPDLTSTKTIKFFEITGIDTNFLNIHPKYWKTNQPFLASQKLVKSLICVNAAERAIALYHCLSKESEKEKLIQVVEENRRISKKLRRTDIVNVLY